MQSIPDAALGAIIAAFITGFVALLGLIISKENKTSEFREAWISTLRTQIAMLVGHLNGIEGTIRRARKPGEGWTEARADIVAVNQCLADIRLRLNPTEKKCEAIATLLDDIERLFVPGQPIDTKQFYRTERLLLQASQSFLKSEWDRVRKGEAVFRFVKTAAVLLLAGAIVSFTYFSLSVRTEVSGSRHQSPASGK